MDDEWGAAGAAEANVDDTARRLIRAEQVSCRAVIIPEGEDPVPSLREAGIIEPVSIPVGWAVDGATAISMGDGWTPGMPATFHPDDDPAMEDVQAAGVDSPGRAQGSDGGDRRLPRTETVMLPEAFGARPFAPVRRPVRE
ncbi:hypothetical protein [Rhodopila sp.]|jgi:hypothetical protein|uniref:hypothetical protein n=1 Tax=Rhodopila sp. TaxID=2480087 RepID=UPI002D01ABC0|nr:hypothetical protein [Rhodopila sp.]HVZ06860.1 hypothetical protein [Rhodopila sp.]